MAVLPERFVFLSADPPQPPVSRGAGAGGMDYLRGYYDALGMALGKLRGGPALGTGGERIAELGGAPSSFQDTEHATWGLQAVKVLSADGKATTHFTGKGVRVAVIDTGIDLTHPAFKNRIAGQFPAVSGETSVQDQNGHGTHVAGTIGGPYPIGVAPDVELYIAKVFPDGLGFADQRNIFAAINWAIDQGCHIASMSLGGDVLPGVLPNPDYEQIGRRALDAGMLLFAASGNNSDRQSGIIHPVSEPANTSTFVAVGAVDQGLLVAYFSDGRVSAGDHGVNFVGPGVMIFSAYPQPALTQFLSGTSQATPHVSGVAALYCEGNGLVSGANLGQLLTVTARTLSLSVDDVGNGLIQAP